MSPYLRARSERLRWLRSSPNGNRASWELETLATKLGMKIARRMVKKRDRRSFSKKRRSMMVVGDRVGNVGSCKGAS